MSAAVESEDPRFAAMGIRLPKKASKEKETDMPKPDTDTNGKIVAADANKPKGVAIAEIVTA